MVLWLNVGFDLGLCGCVYCLHLFYLFVCSWMLLWCLVELVGACVLVCLLLVCVWLVGLELPLLPVSLGLGVVNLMCCVWFDG